MKLASRLGLLDPETLAVHLLQVSRPEMRLLGESGVRVCLCPRSNERLHGAIPDVEGFLRAGLRPALGTDSLASVPSLSIWDEMAFMAEKYAHILPEAILAMGTRNGAIALGREDLGVLAPGKTARMLYVPIEASKAQEAAEKLIWGDFDWVGWI